MQYSCSSRKGACKMVKYCSGTCQKNHRKLHKGECKRRVGDIRCGLLFKRPPPPDECPICMLRIPIDPRDTTYAPCCGQQICGGCVFYSQIQNMSHSRSCPFCRAPDGRSDAEFIQRLEQRIEKNDARAHHIMGESSWRTAYSELTALTLTPRPVGTHLSWMNGAGYVPQDTKRAFKL